MPHHITTVAEAFPMPATTPKDLEDLDAVLPLFAGSCLARMGTAEDGSTVIEISSGEWGDGSAVFMVAMEADGIDLWDTRRSFSQVGEGYAGRFPDMEAVISHLAECLGIRPGVRWPADS